MSKHKKHRQDEDAADAIDEQGQDPASSEYSPEDYEALLAERDELRIKYQRALADYQNAQRRFSADMAAAREAGVERVLHSLIPVLDHFDLALAHDPATIGADQIITGVTMIRDEFSRAMAAFGVTPINPAPNAEFDPAQHEALSQMPAEGIDPGHISGVYQIGYRVGERVVRPSKVTIAPPSEAEPHPGEDAPTEDA